MKKFGHICWSARCLWQTNLVASIVLPTLKMDCVRSFCTSLEDSEPRELIDYLDGLKNYEKSGVPENAGIDSEDGFDLGRMRRLMFHLGNPQSKYKVVHVAGTKGKGSTAAFLSNILRAEGYSVGCYTSPHIRTIRERMSLGTQGEPVSGHELNSLFHRVKTTLDQVVEFENGCLSHFEVLTAIAFKLFADQNVDIAVVEAGLGGARDATNVISSSELAAAIITTIGKEHLAALGGSLETIALAKSGIIKHGRPVILGGPFLPHIEQIICDKAISMSSPVFLSSECGSRSLIKGFGQVNGEPCQSCDVVIQMENTSQTIELYDVNFSMLGHHQLQNAITATCTALCLRDQGWRISDQSIHTALESTQLPGRGQFLKRQETEALGLSGSMVLLDGAHTQESARALAKTISAACRGFKLVLVLAMASDKDHSSFARELLSGLQLEAVFLTEVDIAGGKSRTAAASYLKDIWTKAFVEHNIEYMIDNNVNDSKSRDASVGPVFNSSKVVVSAESSLSNCLRASHGILEQRTGGEPGIIVVTGSLHIVSSVLASVSAAASV